VLVCVCVCVFVYVDIALNPRHAQIARCMCAREIFKKYILTFIYL